MNINIRDEEFILHTSRVLIWPAQKMIIVADIHLGKAQTFLRNGLWLPPTAHHGDLQLLKQISLETGANHILFLGDFVHSLEGITEDVVAEFVSWQESFLPEVTVVIGNHDRPALKYWPAQWKFINLVDQIKINSFTLQHEPPENKSDHFVWCGHIHPKIKLKHAGDSLYLPAFVITPQIGYLPAFSSLAGGAPFKYKKTNRYFVESERKIIEVVF